MTYTEAKIKFDIRLYQWIKPLLEQEIAEEFPSFSLSKGGSGELCRYFRCLTQHEQQILKKGLLQRRHAAAMAALKEPVTTEGDAMVERYWNEFFPMNTLNLRYILTQEEERNLTSKRKLHRAVATAFEREFGKHGLKQASVDSGSELTFQMQCRGWILSTFFQLNHYGPVIIYSHNIWTGKSVTLHEPPVLPFNSIGLGNSYGNEMGIGSMWTHLTDEDIDPVCHEVIRQCRIFFEAAPNLLKGIELDSLTV